jgi:hypothetical protein
MKRLLLTILLFSLTFSACALKPKRIPQPTAGSPQQVEIQPSSLPSDQVQSTETQTPMVKEPPPVPSPVGNQQTSTPVEKKAKSQGQNAGNKNSQKQKGKNPSEAATSKNPDFIASEILGRPTGTSITINVVPAVAMEITYDYGTISGTYTAHTAPQNASAGVPLETLLSGLQPDTKYYYRIHYDEKTGQEHTFMTQRAPGSSFTFDIQGDSHPERVNKQFNSELYTRTLLSAASDQPDFYMTIGDDFSVDQLNTVNASTVTALYINQRQYLGLVEKPVFLVNGNHEQASMANLDNTPDNVATLAQTARNAYFPQPAPDNFYTGNTGTVEHIGLLRDYYAFTWGDALFVVIDPYWHSPQTVDNSFGSGPGEKKKRDLWNVTLGEEQYQWFKNTLENSSVRYKFVFAHHVNGTGRGGIELAKTYEWGDAAQFSAHRPGWSEPIHQLMVDNHVSIFFQGHDHLFARQELDGITYQTLPEPANPNYTTENADAYRSGDKLPNSGHVRVKVSSGGVTVEYIRSYLDKADENAFTYTIK